MADRSQGARDGLLPRSSHFDAEGQARMVDVGAKSPTRREAVARARIRMCESAFSAVREGRVAKGDVLGIARIAGIQAAKRTSDWIPLCHPLPIESVEIQLEPNSARLSVDIEARVLVTAKTGVEMEAMVAASAAALTVYDMCKSLDRAMEIEFVRLVRKSGGKSGVYERIE